jgi:hypothetical protein
MIRFSLAVMFVMSLVTLTVAASALPVPPTSEKSLDNFVEVDLV